MKRVVFYWICCGWMLVIPFTLHAVDDTLCTPNPSAEAVALYRYLLDMKGDRILSGQMYAPWGINELTYIKNITGKQPAVMGVDFIHQSSNAQEVQNAVNWWKSGGIPTIMWHWGAPGVGEGYENSKVAIDIDKCFIEGTPEYTSFWSELKIKADLLETIRDAHVPVLWRPYHELNGNWFWWGKQGPDKFKKLWITMYNYFVHDRGLNNLIWVLCYTGQPDAAWYPGDEYVDIGGADIYDAGNGSQATMYIAVKTITNDKFPIAYHECGIPPDPDLCLAQNAMWSWWMEWHTTWLQGVDTAYLKKVYKHYLVITKDELPDIVSTYGWDSACKPSAVTADVKKNGSSWLQSKKLTLLTGDTAWLKVAAADSGKWTWSGYITQGNDTIKQIVFNQSGSAVATFRNTCGAITSVSFNLADACPPPVISPYIRVDNGGWQQVNSIRINYGSIVKISPQPLTGGTWRWTGAVDATTREITFVPDTTCMVSGEFVSTCGKTARKNFYITVVCPSNPITPYIRVNNNDFISADNVTVFEGDSVTLSPQATAGGTWKWSGAFTAETRDLKFKADSSCIVRVTYTNGCGVNSYKNFTIQVNTVPVAVKEAERVTGSLLYPNPVSGFLYLNSEITKEDPIISILSLHGEILLKKGHNSSGIDISSLKPGMYFIMIEFKERVIVQEFIKNGF
ncbi:MAG TPA: glycosyl hydrolase [Bacteroidales bacterium]|nr:glycosyl hydrolase [Bacteroidales bacterium]